MNFVYDLADPFREPSRRSATTPPLPSLRAFHVTLLFLLQLYIRKGPGRRGTLPKIHAYVNAPSLALV